jgi:hypothetical protein
VSPCELVQSITSTFGIPLEVVCFDEKCAAVGDVAGDRREENVADIGVERRCDSDIFAYVKALCRGCPNQ